LISTTQNRPVFTPRRARTVAANARRTAVLLIGPTGSGKTPLGEFLRTHGLWGRDCRHFDFGAQLRRVAALPRPPSHLSRSDFAVIRRVLAAGTLLQDRQFPVALKTLKWFLSSAAPSGESIIVMNGLPRHVGQARGLRAVLDVMLVVNLSCPPCTAFSRIGHNVGRDRTGRNDSSREAVAKRLRIFMKRTLPLLDYYRSLGVPVLTVRTDTRTTPRKVFQRLETSGKLAGGKA